MPDRVRAHDTLAIAGLHHGFFEALQGNRATGGLLIASIGPEPRSVAVRHRRGVHAARPESP